MENFKEVEKKWRKFWDEHSELYQAIDYKASAGKKYILVEFPYPSGSGLHVGHAFSFTGGDVYARFKRMQGENVLFPMGWDAFGLPTENYAIKMKKKPQQVTKENTDMFRQQMKDLAFSFDWSREVNTTDPAYYKWTQWIFIKLFEKGLAYKKEMPINWCPSCKIGLANEEVVDGKCERCGSEVSRRNISQWVVKITDYADKLIEGLKETNFIDKVKQAQINWIGKSEGAKIKFQIKKKEKVLMIDGFGGNGTSNWFPWLKSELEKQGYEVLNPNLPNNEKPDYKETIESLRNIVNRNESLTVVAHSLGAVTACALITELKIKVNKMILVAPADVNTSLIKRNEGFFGKEAIESISKYLNEVKIDWKTVNDLSKNNYLYFSDNDPYISKEIEEQYKHLNSNVRYFENKGHFNEKAGVMEIPEILDDINDYLEVFTTRPDTLFGATFMVIAPEHELVSKIVGDRSSIVDKNKIQEIKEYVKNARKKSDLERTELSKDKTGVFSGLYSINPVSNKEIPIWISDFVLASYGTGAIMSVPAHDERDYDFAKKFDLEIIPVIKPKGEHDFNKEPYEDVDDGEIINSPPINGMVPSEAFKKMIEWIKEKGIGEATSSFHLRDWIFSRQHYWGEPIPMVNCPKCGWVPVKEANLPIVLPEVEAYEPTDDGKSPLSQMTDWVETTCPKCGGEATRETDTMPNWAGSDWYFLRYMDTHNDTEIASPELIKYWGPVDVYIGGDEHNVLHLLYSRFIYKFLWDLGAVPKELPEPYYKRLSHGVILGPDNQRMSKSKGNVIVPEVVADKYGVDVVRMYLMFMGPFDATMAWNENTLMGVRRFLDRFEKFIRSQQDDSTASSKEVKVLINKLIVGVTEDLENFKYNTAIAKMMECLNKMMELKVSIVDEDIKTLIKLLAPFAPYTTEELYSGDISVHVAQWPVAEDKYLVEDQIKIMISINGKVRDEILVDRSQMPDDKELIERAKKSEKMQKWIEGKKIVKEIYIPSKMINFVIVD